MDRECGFKSGGEGVEIRPEGAYALKGRGPRLRPPLLVPFLEVS